MYAERPSRLPGATLWTSSAHEGDIRVLPDGCIDLMINDGRLVVAGPDTHAKLVPAGAAWVGLRFEPGLASAWLGIPANEIVDTRPDLADLRPTRGVPPTAEGLEEAAVALVGEGRYPEPWISGLVRLLRAGQTVRQVSAELGWSERQLHRKSLAAFGYGPSTLAGILRFQRALVNAGQRPLADVARVAGYADQAHLARAARSLAGVPMTTLLSERSQAGRAA